MSKLKYYLSLIGSSLRRISKYRFFIRILSYFLLLLIPLIIISTIYYINLKAMNENEIRERLQRDIMAVGQNVDLYLRTIQENHLNLLNDNTIHRYLYPDELLTLHERVELNEIHRVLMRASNIVYPYVQHLFMYIDDTRVFHGNGADEFYSFFDKFHSQEHYPASFWRDRLQQNKDYEVLMPTHYVDGRKVLPIINQQLINGEYAVVVSLLSLNSIDQMLERDAYLGTTDYMLFNQSGELLHGYTMNDTDSDLMQAAMHLSNSEFIGEWDGKQIKIDDKVNLISVEESNTTGWRYVSITPASELSGVSDQLFRYVVIWSGTIIMLTFLVSIWLSFRLYSPIRKLSGIVEDYEEISDDGEYQKGSDNEVSRIGDGLRQLFADRNYYQKRLSSVSSHYVEQTLYNLLQGQYVGEDSEIEIHLKERYAFEHNSYLCAVLQFNFQESFYKEIMDVDRFNIISKLRNVVSGLLKPHIRAAVIEYNPYVFVCIVDKPDSEVLDKGLHSIIRTFSNDIHYCHILIGVGELHDGLEGIHTSFEEAMTVIESAQGSAGSQLLHAEQVDIRPHYHYSFQDERQLIHYLQAGDEEQLYLKLEEIIAMNRQLGVSHQSLNQLYVALRSTAIKFAYEKRLPLQLDELQTQPQLVDQLKQLQLYFMQVMNHLQTQVKEDNRQEQLVEMITEYVDQHYVEDLYLERIAEHMGVSAKYISKIFKDKTGSNLTDYIGLKRIKQARELLIHTDIQINEIGTQVGIHSRTTFLRTFKKWEGVAPADYRQMYQIKPAADSPPAE
jgi:two-component system response regulator YesN